MAFTWPLGKIDVINSALSQTGDNLVAVADDGSDEWNVASPAYERAIAVLIEDASYGWSTVVNPNLTPSSTAPANTAWDTAYPLPSDLIHLIWVRINQDTTDPTSQTLGQPTLYDIEGGMLVLNVKGGPPPPSTTQTPGIVSIKYVANPVNDVQASTPLFVLALQAFTMSGIYRGLHEDTVEADKLWMAGEQFANRARARYDQQKPKRAFWNSRINASRRVRHPYPAVGNDWWGGTASSG